MQTIIIFTVCNGGYESDFYKMCRVTHLSIMSYVLTPYTLNACRNNNIMSC